MANGSVISVETQQISVDLATGFGPRVVALRPENGSNLLVDLGDLGVDLPDGRRYTFRGGHRLWVAPEVMEISYEPDDHPVEVVRDALSVTATGSGGGLEKTIHISVDNAEAKVTVDHVITNSGPGPRELAPWAITQLRPGGMAMLPVGIDHVDPQGLQALTRVVGWPYTDWAALASSPDHRVLYIDGKRETPTKVGTSLSPGWLAYQTSGWLFAKYADTAPSAVDLGAAGQVYACPDFVELETLGVLTALAPGETARHREIWRVWPAPPSLEEAIALVATLRS